MEFKDINSSNLMKAGYDAENKTLVVEFKNGSRYRYADVDRDLYDEFEKEFDGEDGRSAGRFFHREIRPLPAERVQE